MSVPASNSNEGNSSCVYCNFQLKVVQVQVFTLKVPSASESGFKCIVRVKESTGFTAHAVLASTSPHKYLNCASTWDLTNLPSIV